MASTEHARQQAMRVWQTPRTFSNWATVLADMTREKVGRRPETLTVTTHGGLVIQCPNRAGARVPIYEIFAETATTSSGSSGRWPGSTSRCSTWGADRHVRVPTGPAGAEGDHPTYEPSPTSASVLRGNVERNGFGDRITVVEQALAATVGTAELDDTTKGAAARTASSARRAAAGPPSPWRRRPSMPVAALPGPPNVVKIGCEGGEYDLVAASSPENWASVERLVIEYHRVPGHSWDELGAWFGGVGLFVQHRERLGGASAWCGCRSSR